MKIKLADLGITDLKFRVTVSDARMLEIGGEERGEKADALME